jgi:8-oxo-dGTP diphosphatase
MTEVKFYDRADDSLLKFAVIITRSNGQWVFCKHKKRDTYEVPGGHRESGETILETARRELYEETGALEYSLTQVCVYSVTAPGNFDGKETFGMLFYADVQRFEKELHSEIEKIILTDALPENWTYPLIQPKLMAEAQRRGVL